MAKRNPFLSLPVELRTRIYELHFAEEPTVDVPALYDEVREDMGLWHDQQPPITRVNRQLRAESLPTFYAFCTFQVWMICAPCMPDDIARAHLPSEAAIPEPRSKTCQCILDHCYRRSESQPCRSVYISHDPWRWVAGLGAQNLSHIRTLSLEHGGLSDYRLPGYKVTVHQHSLTRRLTVSEDSFWQDKYDPHTREIASKILGSEPSGKAIIDEIDQALREDETGTEGEGCGLTLARIYKILDVTYRRSLGRIDLVELIACEEARRAAARAAERRLAQQNGL